MPYPKLIAMIDAELEQLRRARRLLAPQQVPEPRARRGKPEPAHKVPAPAVQVFPGEPRRFRRVLRKTPREKTDKRTAGQPTTATAFRSGVSTHPVYVPAVRVQPARNEPTASVGVAAANENLSPERLARRWLLG